MASFQGDNLLAEYESYNAEKQEVLEHLKTHIYASGEPLEGNSFYIHGYVYLYHCLYTKQVNLFWCGKQATTRICEIGFNAGHSTMLMLLGREKTPLDFTIFDIGTHRYTKPCFTYIQSKYSHIKFEYIEGDSTSTMPKWIEKNPELVGVYDVVHVDGGHTEHCISNDMKNSDILVKITGIMIIDDTNNSYINDYVDKYIHSGNYKELDVLKTEGYPHRIIQKIK